MRYLRVLLLGLLALAVLWLPTGVQSQATFIVDSTSDIGDSGPGDGVCDDGFTNCTLRAAIQETNALSGADTINLPAGVYTLSIPGTDEDAAATGDLDITDDLTITGAGRDVTVIDGGEIDRVLETVGSVSADISGVTIRNGSTASFFPMSPGGVGGGIFNDGTLTLTNVTISGNSAGSSGGGIYNEDEVTLTNSAVRGNAAVAGGGGGIANTGRLTVASTTISGNTAEFGGGGIANYGSDAIPGPWGTATLTNSTVNGNSAGLGGGGGGIGNGGSLVLANVTLSDNSAPSGGSIERSGFDSVCVSHTIIANAAAGGNCNFPITSEGHNLEDADTCDLTGPGDIVNADPLLGPLADNGGPTQTHALLAGSPAIDGGHNIDCPATDQRGVARPVDGNGDGVAACDIGAYEAPAGTTTPTPTPTPAVTPTPTPTAMPTATPRPAAAQLPPTGGAPTEGEDGTPAAVAAVFITGMAGIAGVLALRRQGRRLK